MRSREDPLTEAPTGPVIPRRLPSDFFVPSTLAVARRLLGSFLVTGTGPRRRLARIVETEAYRRNDPASHSFRGPTERNRAMFGPAGRWYVYRIHQVCCANVTTGAGEAVLLRAAEPGDPRGPSMSGPGRLARAVGLELSDNGRSVRSSRVWIARGSRPRERILSGPRIGISRARDRRWRFALEGVRAVSRPRPAPPSPSDPPG